MGLTLVGDTALVSGAARGIGKACVEALLRAGCARVYSVDLAAHEVPDGAIAVACDVADVDSVDALVDRADDRIAILVNNAGIYEARDALEISDEAWRRTFDVIVNGTFYFTRAVARRLIADHAPGAVINISSIAGKRAFPMQADYCAAKAAVLGFTRAAALDLAPHRITVNAICPGTINTPMIHQVITDLALVNGISDDEQRDALLRDIPIGRMQEPEEIAAGVVYLASNGSRAVTGEALTIDGGLSRD